MKSPGPETSSVSVLGEGLESLKAIGSVTPWNTVIIVMMNKVNNCQDNNISVSEK